MAKKIAVVIGVALMIIGMRMSNDGFSYKYCRYHDCPDNPASWVEILLVFGGASLATLPFAIPWLRRR